MGGCRTVAGRCWFGRGKEKAQEGAGADARGIFERAWRFARLFSVWDAEAVEEEAGASYMSWLV